MTNDSISGAVVLARGLALKTGAIISISGAIDIISDSERTFTVRNGNALMSKVSGTGCMLSAVTAAFLASAPGRPLEASVSATTAMGVCGELAADAAGALGYSSFRTALIDAMSRLSDGTLAIMSKIEEVNP